MFTHHLSGSLFLLRGSCLRKLLEVHLLVFLSYSISCCGILQTQLDSYHYLHSGINYWSIWSSEHLAAATVASSSPPDHHDFCSELCHNFATEFDYCSSEFDHHFLKVVQISYDSEFKYYPASHSLYTFPSAHPACSRHPPLAPCVPHYGDSSHSAYWAINAHIYAYYSSCPSAACWVLEAIPVFEFLGSFLMYS